MSAQGVPSTCRWRVAAILIAVLGLLCLGAGIALPFIAGGFLGKQLAVMLPISNTSVAYSAWVSSELRFQVWMWNLTNPKQVLDAGAVPALSQVGPFTFRETRVREGVQFHPNGTVGYEDTRTYFFLPGESIGHMADYQITNVNLPYIGVALSTRSKMLSVRKILSGYLGSSIFSTRTVEELLLGYEDRKMRGLSRMARLLDAGGSAAIPSRFGILLGKNATAKGSALVGTGLGDLNNLNQVMQWNGKPKLSLWRQDWANQLAGTDGTMFTPPVHSDKTLVVFTPDLCRSANMTYRRTDTVQGIPVLAFSPAKTAMMNATGNPQNLAFCTPRCLDSGVLNLTLCLPGNPPVVASAPHFFRAPTYAAMVSGIDPRGEFETRLEIEPNTGLLMRAARRMQINIALEYVEGFPDTKRFGDLFLMPYLWLNESGAIGSGPAAQFKQRVLWPLRLASLISWLLVALGIALIILAGVVGCLELQLRSVRQRPRVQRSKPDDTRWPPKDAAELLQKNQLKEHEKRESDLETTMKHLPETAIVD